MSACGISTSANQRAWPGLSGAGLCLAVTRQWPRGLPGRVLETPALPGFRSKGLGMPWPLPRRKVPSFPAVRCGQGSGARGLEWMPAPARPGAPVWSDPHGDIHTSVAHVTRVPC